MFEEIPKNCRYAYAKVSSESQEENSSLETQKQEFIQLFVDNLVRVRYDIKRKL
jgi:hypothetical protein